jgi:flavin-dependent dehydrogenase
MEDGIDKLNFITIAIHPAKEGFACLVLEKDSPPMTKEYSIALTMAHGMVKMALERPDLVFDEGIDAMANPSYNKLIDINEVIANKKRKLH